MSSVLKLTVGAALAIAGQTALHFPASANAAPLSTVQAPVQNVATASELMQMAGALADLHRFDEAITAYTLALQQEPQNGEILANRALSYAWVNRIDEASIDLDRAERLLPDLAILHRVRAIIADRRSDEDRELKELTKSLVLEPTNAFALSFRAQIYQRRHLYQAAIGDADAYIRTQPDEPEAYLTKAQLLGAQRRWPEALAVARLLELRFSGEPRALASASQIYSDAGDRAKALVTINRAIQLDQGLFHFWDMRAGMRPWADFEGRQADLETALKLASGDLGIVTKLGLLEFSRNRWAEAKADFTQVLDKDPKDFGVLAYRAMSLIRLGDQPAALADYNAALSATSGPDDLNLICRQFARQGMALNWALDTCSKALANNPKKPSYLINLGLVQLRLGHEASAHHDFDQAISINPDSGEAYYGRGLANYRAGDLSKAAQDRKTALDIDPNIEEDFCAHGMSDMKIGGSIKKFEGTSTIGAM